MGPSSVRDGASCGCCPSPLLHSASLYGRRLHLYVGVQSVYLGKEPRDFTIVAPERERVLMSVEENKALVRRYWESGQSEAMRGNLDVIHQYFADHFHDHTSLHPDDPGVQGMKEQIAEAGQATPDLRTEVVDIAAEDDLVFVHWRVAGTHEGQYKVVKHVRDVEPTGEEATVSGISLYRLEGGKFVESWGYHNVLEYTLARGKAGAPRGGS